MVTVEWEGGPARLEVLPGERLLDVADTYPKTGTLFGCRSGHCGTCRVRVLQGHSVLAEARPDELETLAALAAQPDERLSCQLTITTDVRHGHVRLLSMATATPDPTRR